MKRALYFFVVLAFLASLGILPGNARADEPYPTRPIQVIVPFPPGRCGRPCGAAIYRGFGKAFETARGRGEQNRAPAGPWACRRRPSPSPTVIP